VPASIQNLSVIAFVAEMRQSNPNSAVIWYDAVTVEGELDWQNELNAKNKIFLPLKIN
jgi:endo-beta-N-acetylglucosaminidase D